MDMNTLHKFVYFIVNISIQLYILQFLLYVSSWKNIKQEQ